MPVWWLLVIFGLGLLYSASQSNWLFEDTNSDSL
jgi:hypothetical protein